MLQLREKDKKIICDLIASSFSVSVEAWAYGSRVDGTSHETSDLDLVLRGPQLQALDLHELNNLRGRLRESQIPIIVQAFDWAQLPESFHQNIMNNYVVLEAD